MKSKFTHSLVFSPSLRSGLCGKLFASGTGLALRKTTGSKLGHASSFSYSEAIHKSYHLVHAI